MTEATRELERSIRGLNWTYALIGAADATLLPYIPLYLAARHLDVRARAHRRQLRRGLRLRHVRSGRDVRHGRSADGPAGIGAMLAVPARRSLKKVETPVAPILRLPE